jgi:hypothetical protein
MMPDPLYAYPQKARLALYLVLSGTVSLASIAGMIGALWMELEFGPTVFLIALLFGPAYFIGKLSLSYVRRLRQPGPDIAIDANGLLVQSHADKPIAWDNILWVRQKQMGLGQTLFYIEFIDATQDPPRKADSRLTRYSRRRQKMGDLIFATEGMNVSDADVQHALASHLNWMSAKR